MFVSIHLFFQSDFSKPWICFIRVIFQTKIPNLTGFVNISTSSRVESWLFSGYRIQKKCENGMKYSQNLKVLPKNVGLSAAGTFDCCFSDCRLSGGAPSPLPLPEVKPVHNNIERGVNGTLQPEHCWKPNWGQTQPLRSEGGQFGNVLDLFDCFITLFDNGWIYFSERFKIKKDGHVLHVLALFSHSLYI